MITVNSVLLLLFLQLLVVQGSKFRYDYKYFEPVKGWLKFHRVPATWYDARLLCHAEGAVLASPLTQELHKAMVDVSQTHKVDDIFTGIHSLFSKGTYASIEGVPILDMIISWLPRQPDNYKNSESCLEMVISKNGTMNDVKCSSVHPFICYKKKTEELLITECGTHDTKYNLDKRTGSCYKFHPKGLVWSRAQMTCMSEGGHLVIINSEQEALLVKELFAKYPSNVIFTTSKLPQFAYVGIFDFGDGGSWMTVHGQTLTEAGYDRWEPNQPANESQPVGEYCGVIDKDRINIWDASCNWLQPFICEKQPDSLEHPGMLL